MKLWADESWLHERLNEVHRQHALQNDQAGHFLVAMGYAVEQGTAQNPRMLKLTVHGAHRLQDLTALAQRMDPPTVLRDYSR
ncbi:hypothetical protein WG628_11775 [Stenotrophomonas maltophilia]|nr:hypothetical protein [Stenotrophomonas maltophilia]